MGTVPHTTPPCRVKILPDASQANSHPLAQKRVWIIQLFQTNSNQVPLKTGFLQQRVVHHRVTSYSRLFMKSDAEPTMSFLICAYLSCVVIVDNHCKDESGHCSVFSLKHRQIRKFLFFKYGDNK